MYTVPSVWFFVVVVPVLFLLILGHVQLRRSNAADDALWAQLQRKLDRLNRRWEPPRPTGSVLYAASSVSTVNLVWAPGAMWPVDDPGDVKLVPGSWQSFYA